LRCLHIRRKRTGNKLSRKANGEKKGIMQLEVEMLLTRVGRLDLLDGPDDADDADERETEVAEFVAVDRFRIDHKLGSWEKLKCDGRVTLGRGVEPFALLDQLKWLRDQREVRAIAV